MGRHISILPDPTSAEAINIFHGQTVSDSAVIGCLPRPITPPLSPDSTPTGYPTMPHPHEDDVVIATVGLTRICHIQILYQAGVHRRTIDEHHGFCDDAAGGQNY